MKRKNERGHERCLNENHALAWFSHDLDFGFKNPHKFTRLIRGFKAFEFLSLPADKIDDKISFVPQISGTDQDYEEGPATIWVIVNPKG